MASLPRSCEINMLLRFTGSVMLLLQYVQFGPKVTPSGTSEMVAQATLYAVIAVLAAIGLCSLGIGALLVCVASVVRPWDGNARRDCSWSVTLPYPMFWAGTWIQWAASYMQALKPGPMRAAEIASTFVMSQVLFTLVNLGIPDLLLSGARPADDLAANIGPHVHPDRLARILDFAAAFGMINRKKANRKPQNGHRSAAPAAVLALDPSNKDTAATGTPRSSSSSSAPVYVYSLNATTASLTSESPMYCADMVKFFEDRYKDMAYLSKALRDGTVPFEAFSGGKTFWQHLGDNPRAATTFDLAMAQFNYLGGKAVAATYPFSKFETVMDIAGGVGGFLWELMVRYNKLQGVLVDQPGQINRAEKLWAQDLQYKPLAHRVQLVAGDIFDASTIPAPPEGSGMVAYILEGILHDWPDAECVSILRGIRKRVPVSDASRVKLLIIEPTSMETPCHNVYPHRLLSDLLMLTAFGDAKERNKQQFEALFGATGWRLTKIAPSNGIFVTLEAIPV